MVSHRQIVNNSHILLYYYDTQIDLLATPTALWLFSLKLYLCISANPFIIIISFLCVSFLIQNCPRNTCWAFLGICLSIINEWKSVQEFLRSHSSFGFFFWVSGSETASCQARNRKQILSCGLKSDQSGNFCISFFFAFFVGR